MAGWSLMVLASMAGTFTLGWTSRENRFSRLPLLRAAESAGHGVRLSSSDDRRSNGDPSRESEMVATGPAVGAPAADADAPVIFPGYVVPDDSLEEPAHEGN
jgi:hypothetical protein